MGDSEQPQYPRFESCLIRLASYATWTQYECFDRYSLAQAGFFNNADGTTDVIQVKCFCCGKEFNSMKPDDDFLFQHFKRSPNCRYLRQILGTNSINEYQEKIHGTENQVQEQVQETSRNPGQWIASDCLRSPQYQTYSARLSTFVRWPSHMSQTPKQVADAGFYYTGIQDIVRCFACDGGLKNWDPEDDPWIEHARWFPQCPFVECVKGQEFIDLVRRIAEEFDEEEDEDAQSTSDLNYSVMATSDLNREEDCDLLTNDYARIVIECGYSASIVARAITTLRSKGNSVHTASQIIQAIFDMEGRGEIAYNENASSSVLPMNTDRLQCSDQSSAEAEQPQQRKQCAYCGMVEISFIWCNNHCSDRNCAMCKFICPDCSNASRDRDT
ncbi:hypothetical protein CHS0354_027129 [Potamilus streckersoni]|uniref:Uncharacterized protein n=1 Tax=Potamilus streckersoni TaxID=2493646 RepID=A0AAE0VJ18_9BIVA|nr:hypothetical protein CHS0354_027129 [Potamilus streckersoni]